MGVKQQAGTSQTKLMWLCVAIVVIVFAGVSFYIIQPLLTSPPLPDLATNREATLIANAQAALKNQDYAVARAMAEEVLATDATLADALLVAGESAARMGETSKALEYYLAVKNDGSDGYVTSRWAAGNIALAEAKLSDAEALFREALAVSPHNVISHERLAFILGVEARHWEAQPHLFDPVRQGRIALEPLILLGVAGARSITNSQMIFQAMEITPDDPLLSLGMARMFLDKGDLAEAKRLVREVLQQRPDQIEAHAILGQVVVQEGDATEVQTWLDDLPDAAEAHPETWYWRAVWAAQQGETKPAARGLWETVKLQPNHLEANRRLAELLPKMGREQDAEPFRQQYEKLEELRTVLNQLYELRENTNPDAAMVELMMQAAKTTEGLGRLWESWAWYQLVLVVEPKNTQALKQVQRIRAEVSRDSDQVIADARPARYVDLGSLPLPE